MFKEKIVPKKIMIEGSGTIIFKDEGIEVTYIKDKKTGELDTDFISYEDINEKLQNKDCKITINANEIEE